MHLSIHHTSAIWTPVATMTDDELFWSIFPSSRILGAELT